MCGVGWSGGGGGRLPPCQAHIYIPIVQLNHWPVHVKANLNIKRTLLKKPLALYKSQTGTPKTTTLRLLFYKSLLCTSLFTEALVFAKVLLCLFHDTFLTFLSACRQTATILFKKFTFQKRIYIIKVCHKILNRIQSGKMVD